MERGTGLEPATICLEGRDSTTELPPLMPCKLFASVTPNPKSDSAALGSAACDLEPGTGIEPVTSSLPRTRSTN
jgi:hypothetical protein